MIQYPKNTHVTLPSVEGAFGSMNIQKDPHKSIVVPYKPKYSETNMWLDLVDESGDRICEQINHYSRGINPMMSVNYTNAGNSGGIRGSNIQTSAFANLNAYSPYPVGKYGAFRPPIKAPRDLLPLSRLPRTNFSTQAQIGSNAITRSDMSSLYCATDKQFKEINQDMLTAYAEQRPWYNIEKPVEVDVRHNVHEQLNASLETNKHIPLDNTKLNNAIPNNGLSKVNREYSTVSARAFKNINVTPLANQTNTPIRVKDHLNISVNSNQSGHEQNIEINTPMLSRNTPNVSINTTKQLPSYSNGIVSDNPIKERHSLQLGSFTNAGCVTKTV